MVALLERHAQTPTGPPQLTLFAPTSWTRLNCATPPSTPLFCTITVLTGLREKLFCTSTPAPNVMLGLTAIFRLFTITPLTPSIVTSPALSPVQSFVRVAL